MGMNVKFYFTGGRSVNLITRGNHLSLRLCNKTGQIAPSSEKQSSCYGRWLVH